MNTVHHLSLHRTVSLYGESSTTMLRLIITSVLVYLVWSQKKDCVPMKMLQRKLCQAMESGQVVLKMKVRKDLTNSPEDNHRYSMKIIRKVNKEDHIIRLQQYSTSGNGILRCKSCVIEIPRECNLDVGAKYLVTASYQTDKALLIAGCDDVIEWADLSNFQRGRLLGHGYSCNTEICYDDCIDDERCKKDAEPVACQLNRDNFDCYDKYAECSTNQDSSNGDWNMLTPEFNSCLLLDNSDPFPTNPPNSSNSTNVTST
ncbi:uncharacterized protein LOC128159879 isoform X2 [Crassostrea angulata]|uniref:uncharacterized protein LOC128159879 isoform X2 n=1 Tax=Magallana angulata TaxID=2784310 RepID=UPI0022B174E7|nr:uncharacterized protein LOC128159879 isoform X2 [Crassostrea angulata]